MGRLNPRGVVGVLLFLSAWIFAGQFSANAQGPASADRAAIQAAISGQIAALGREDAEGAYAFASQGIKSLFPSPSEFLTMVKAGYGALIRPRSLTFGDLVLTPDGPIQQVFVVDNQDRSWIAAYALEPGPDGNWRINGCVLARDKGTAI